MLESLHDLIGHEHDLDTVSKQLAQATRDTGAPVVGALEVNCSDECELECIDAFQRNFVDVLLPELKQGIRAPFRTCNLGARYEWGSVHVAEHHYATAIAQQTFKTCIVKINGHVSVEGTPGTETFGPMTRYEAPSTACGALHALLGGADLPAMKELRQQFTADGVDRIATLLDPAQVEEVHRYLFAAITSTLLQARVAAEDIQQRPPHSPTLFVVLPCLTLNRHGPDTEILCGAHTIDLREQTPMSSYAGLGDRPERYAVTRDGDALIVTDAESDA